MKQISSLDVGLLASEIAKICPCKLYQVYQPEKKQLVLQFHVRNKGRAVLRVRVPNAIYLADSKETGISGFCSSLRKKLNNSFLKKVSQLGFERILQFDFSSKNGNLSLILEFFSKGNIILLDEAKIIAVEEWQHWSSRVLKPGQEYKNPPESLDPFSLDEKKLLELSKTTKKKDLVRFLAIELSLGGLYSEEVCLTSGLDKQSKPSSLEESDAKKLLKALTKLLKAESSPSVILEDDQVVDVVPIKLGCYKDKQSKPFETFSQALEHYYSVSVAARPSENDKENSKFQSIISQQKEAIEIAKADIEKNSLTGRLIYENYQELKDLIDLLNKERKEKGWDSLDNLKKSNEKLKSVDGKSGKIVVDI